MTEQKRIKVVRHPNDVIISRHIYIYTNQATKNYYQLYTTCKYTTSV